MTGVENAHYQPKGWFNPDRSELLPMLYDEGTRGKNVGKFAENYWNEKLCGEEGVDRRGFAGIWPTPAAPEKASLEREKLLGAALGHVPTMSRLLNPIRLIEKWYESFDVSNRLR